MRILQFARAPGFMSSMLETKIFEDLIANVAKSSKSRVEVYMAPVPDLDDHVREDLATKHRKTKPASAILSHNRSKSAHVIGEHKMYDATQLPMPPVTKFHSTMSHDLNLEQMRNTSESANDKTPQFSPPSHTLPLERVVPIVNRNSTFGIHGSTNTLPDSDSNYTADSLKQVEAIDREKAFLAKIRRSEEITRAAVEKKKIRDRVVHLIERKFTTGEQGNQVKETANNATSSSNKYYKIKEVEELWEKRNKHIMKKASKRHPPTESANGQKSAAVSAFYSAIRRRSFVASEGATNALKSKVSAYKLLGIPEQ